MTSRPDDSPFPFSDPNMELAAQQGLNRLVLTLWQRLYTPPESRAQRIGALHVIEDPALSDLAFKTPTLFQKDFALVAALGQSRFNLNGDRWAQFRDRTQPAYNKASKPSETPDVATLYRDALDAISPRTGADLLPALNRGALAVFCKALGIALDPDAVARLFPHIRSHAKLLQFFSWYGMQQADVLTRRAEWLDQCFDTLVRGNPQACDFVRQAISGQSTSEWSPAVTDLMQNLFAGIETTVATLSWAVQLLGQNHAVQEALRTEATLPLQDRTLTRSFLSETMRCFPPIPFVVRALSDDYTGHGRHFSKGDQVIISVVGLHRHPGSWTEPNAFHAARSEFADGQPIPRAFRPFLSGPRVCGGKRLAELEMLVALPAILQRWRIVSASSDISYDYALALRPHDLSTVQLEALSS
jgi:cytochrome P450